MKILITGTTGFIGRSLAEFYQEQGYDLIAPLRGYHLPSILEQQKPDVIINSAAEIYDADVMFDSNIVLTKTFLDWVKENPSTKMIQLGSSAEYGPLDRPSAETDPINPVDIYQATKGAATLLCQGYARYYDLKIAVARPYSVYGAHEKPHRLFPRLYQAFFSGSYLNIYDGEHDFIYIDDFVRGVDILVRNNFDPGEIVNLGSGVQSSNDEVLAAWEQVVGHPAANIIRVNKFSKAYESKVWCCDTSHARDKFGFTVQFDLVSGIADFIKKAKLKGKTTC